MHDSYFDTHYIPLPNINDVSCIYGDCSLPRIDERIHSHCRLSSKFYGLPKRKKERELYEKELIAYETRMMTDSVFIKGLYESFDAFNLNKDCLDSLKEYYQNVREK